MQLILFTGVQASGKSTYYKANFADTHVRINLDMLRTRRREELLVNACLQAKAPFVVDNTNVTPEERARYIQPARAAGFEVIGYYFQSKIEECKLRNNARPRAQAVPLNGVLGSYARLKKPVMSEGYTRLYYVRIEANGLFVTEEWNNEV